MSCQGYKELMMGYLDDELDEGQSKALEAHLAGCKECSGELEEFRKLKQITEGVTLAEPEDRLWEQYWGGVYNRTERSFGWILFGVSGILLLMYAGFKCIEAIVKDPTVGVLLKAGLLALIAGAAILLVSVARERLYFRKRDRYKDVRR